MPRNSVTDQKARKQKIVLAACGGLLLLLAAIQGPKLLRQLNPPAPAASPAPATTTPASAPAPAGTVSPATTRPAVAGGASTALVAGVALSTQTAPAVGDGQLRSFTLFTSKDPFVPQVAEAAPSAGTGGAAPPASTTPAPSKPAPSAAPPSAAPPSPPAAAPGSASGSTPPVTTPPAYATVLVNGTSQALTLKDKFPKTDPLFVLVSLKKKVAKVGVVGGAFASGSTIAIDLGAPVTVVNDATGARYVMELVYTGAAPEQVATFTAPAPTPAPAKK